MNRTLYEYIKYILLVGFGCLAGVIFSNWSYFTIGQSIEAVDVANLVITSLLGLYIAKTLQNQQSIVRSEKDFLISELKDFKTDLVKIKSDLERNCFEFEKTKSFFKDLNQRLKHFTENCQISSYCKKADSAKIQQDLIVLRSLITSIRPVNGNITLHTITKLQVEKRLNSINTNIYALIITINKL